MSSRNHNYSTLRGGHNIQPCFTLLSVFISSQVDLLLVHPHFLLIVPFYILLGRCSVILSPAGCLYDPRTEIWLARTECLSFFPFPPSLPLLRSSLSLFFPCLLLCCFCMPASPFCSTRGWNKLKSSSSWHYFFHVRPCISFKAPLFYFWLSGHCFDQLCRVWL